MNTLTRGIWAGILATAPMTLTMFKFHQALPEEERSPLAPAILTSQIFEAVLPRSRLNTSKDLSMLSHFAFGASCAILYCAASPHLKMNPWVKGSLFGLGVWSANYLGLIPAFNLRPSAKNTPGRRNFMMIASHVVWGATLGYSESELRRRGDELLNGERKKSEAE